MNARAPLTPELLEHKLMLKPQRFSVFQLHIDFYFASLPSSREVGDLRTVKLSNMYLTLVEVIFK